VKSDKTQIALGAAFLGAFAGFWYWHSPLAKKLTPEEIDRYLAAIAELPLPDDEAEKLIPQLRLWAEADDGGPVYMVNLNRYFPELRRYPGTPEFDGTPQEGHARYQKSLTSKVLRLPGYPMISGLVQGPKLMTTRPDEPNWDHMSFVRYPSRRKFLDLLSDPYYAEVVPYKFMALREDLVPISGDRVLPDFRLVVGGSLLAAFLAIGWLRAVRR
jgi:hypothetical protein